MLPWVKSLLFPLSCMGCRRPLEETPSIPLCSDCKEELPHNRPPWCRGCGLSLAGQGAGVEFCMSCRSRVRPYDRVWSPFLYKGVIRQLLWALKYEGQISLACPLAQTLGEFLQTAQREPVFDACFAVPLHTTRLRERSFNQSELLARVVSQVLDLPYEERLLIRHKATPPQIELPREQRRKNVRDAFSLAPKARVQGRSFLLVDDVFTTGSTAGACSALLKRAGASAVEVAVFAHG